MLCWIGHVSCHLMKRSSLVYLNMFKPLVIGDISCHGKKSQMLSDALTSHSFSSDWWAAWQDIFHGWAHLEKWSKVYWLGCASSLLRKIESNIIKWVKILDSGWYDIMSWWWIPEAGLYLIMSHAYVLIASQCGMKWWYDLGLNIWRMSIFCNFFLSGLGVNWLDSLVRKKEEKKNHAKEITSCLTMLALLYILTTLRM